MKDQFYFLQYSLSDKFIGIVLENPFDIKIPSLAQFVRGKNQMDLDEISFMTGSGREIDIIMNYGYNPIIREDIADLFLEYGLTGWTSSRIIIKLKEKEYLTNYKCMFITGSCGPILYYKAPIIIREVKVNDRIIKEKFRKGIIIDVNSWSKDDFFMSSDTSGYIMLTEKAKDVFDRINSKNAKCLPIESAELYAD